MTDPIYIATVIAAFLIAGSVKGAVGMGLPPTAVALATLTLPLPEVLVLITVPVLVTNFWQAFWGGHFAALVRRFWSMALAMVICLVISALGIRELGSPLATGILGLLLALFAAIALLAWQPRVPRSAEPWCNPLIGALTGLVGGITGIAAIPFLPYMQALDLTRDQLIQALGILFICFTLTLAAALVNLGIFNIQNAGAALFATIPTLAGLWLGQILRRHVSAETFRRMFLVAMLGFGLNMARSLF